MRRGKICGRPRKSSTWISSDANSARDKRATQNQGLGASPVSHLSRVTQLSRWRIGCYAGRKRQAMARIS